MYTFYPTKNQEKFFALLPEDWSCEIEKIWTEYRTASKIYMVNADEKAIAGGIVFSTCSPDMLYNKSEADKWFLDGYLYIGFLWVHEAFRGKKIGTFWLNSLKSEFSLQKYWLTIEEEGLMHFYIKNGFRCVKQLQHENLTEWLLVYEPTI